MRFECIEAKFILDVTNLITRRELLKLTRYFRIIIFPTILCSQKFRKMKYYMNALKLQILKESNEQAKFQYIYKSKTNFCIIYFRK